MTKSIIEQELERLDRDCINDHCNDCINSAIQKSFEELMKNRYCNSTIAFHICDKNPDDCNFIVEWLDIEKCFGEVKDAKNK